MLVIATDVAFVTSEWLVELSGLSAKRSKMVKNNAILTNIGSPDSSSVAVVVLMALYGIYRALERLGVA